MTLSSPIFRKLFGSALLVIAVTLLGLDFYLRRYTRQREVDNVEQRLRLEGQILAAELENLAPGPLEQWSREAGTRASARVTVIDPRGLVLADSQHDPETMENHANRPEIREALQGKVGTAIRHSHTLDRDLCYLAMPVKSAGKPGLVLRLAVPLEDIDAAVAGVHKKIWVASLAAAVLALGIAYVFSRSFTRHIGRLKAFAENLMDAAPSTSGVLMGDDELAALGRSLARTAAQLRELVSKLGLESARREAILASMVEGVLAVDGDLRVTFCNESFARAVGVKTPVPEGLPLLELVRDSSLADMFTRVLATRELGKERLQIPAADGREFEVQTAPLAAPSRPGAIAILHDVTDLERLERVRKDFVANVSHELRTPLTAIRGYAETLLEGGLEDGENNRRFVEIIKAHAVRLTNIATDLLVLSELESGKSMAEPERISVRAAIESALRTVESEARVRGVSLVCGPLQDAEAVGDRLRLEQALVNLLDNAVKFNRQGGEVRVESDRTADGNVCITIADTGIGIPFEAQPRIFERFYRVDKARSREEGGTGLGLSIVKHVVERMNGTIAVDSAVGKGSIFTVQFPAA